MNPTVNNNNSKFYQQSLSYVESIRDKTKSHLLPNGNYSNFYNTPATYNQQHQNNQQYQQPFIESSNILNNNLHNNNSFVNVNNQPLVNNYSDRYKSYYTEQSHAHDKSKEKQSNKYYQSNNKQNYTTFNENNLLKALNTYDNDTHYNRSTILPHSPSLKQQKSLQRKRFLTAVTSKSPENASSSMINPKQYIRQSKQPYQFAAHKLAISKVSNNSNKVQNNNYQQKSRQKRLYNNNDPNKKISLKRDIISPRYEEFQKHKKLSLIQQRTKPDIGIFQKTYSTNYLEEKDSFINDNFKKREQFYFQEQSGLMKMEKLPIEQICNETKNAQVFVSNKNNDKKQQVNVRKSVTALQLQKQGKNQLILNKKQMTTKKQDHNKKISVTTNIQQKRLLSSPKQQQQKSSKPSVSKSPKTSNLLMIDNDIYQDMKISRIQQSTLSLQEKYQQVQKMLFKLKKSDQQHQSQIALLKAKLLKTNRNDSLEDNKTTRTIRTQDNNNNISNNNQSNEYNHDLKRIKKQLKIIKNNFQLAFTSMTQQINRKLVKQQQIMKNLSQQIKMVATQNIKLSQSIEQKSSKVQELQKSMNSFMQQNQQRIQNLVLLNDSFSSSANKRNRNNHSSFQYGLQLKNMSADQGWMSSRDKQAVQGLKNKVEYLQKEIKKMKVYHMEEKDVNISRVNDIKSNVDQLKSQIGKIKNQITNNTLPSIVSQIITQKFPLLMEPQISLIKENIYMNQQELNEKIKQLTQSMQQIKQYVKQQMYEYRLGKLYPQENNSNLDWINSNKAISPSISSINDRQIISLKDKINTIEQKLSFNDKRLVTIQEKHFYLIKTQQQQKLKQLKHSGDIRQLQHSLKQYNSKIRELTTNNKEFNNSLQAISSTLRQFATNIDNQIVQINRVNQIQTENIQSINNQFQRVINKQIIPKFQQIHNNNLQIQKKLTLIKVALKEKDDKFIQKGIDTYKTNTQSISLINDDNTLLNKIQIYVNENINKFINTKVKLFSTKLISNKSPLTKLGLYQNKYNNTLSSSTVLDSDYEVDKENTYLVDENGYLMDWEGCYLTEVGNDGSRNKIKLTQKEIYFMEANGINVSYVTQFI